MPKKRRYIIPNLPHHVTQRGTRRGALFFCTEDYRFYLNTLSNWCKREDVAIWSYCLMPNHVHLILTPKSSEGMSKAIGQTHRIYARHINEREEWTGNLWQERFYSSVMDDGYLLNAVRYVVQNPVRANLVGEASRWLWSSARAHITGTSDGIIDTLGLASFDIDWRNFLSSPLEGDKIDKFRENTSNFLPLGEEPFVKNLEQTLGVFFKLPRLGRPKKK